MRFEERERSGRAQAGYLMVALMTAITVMAILAGVAVQSWTDVLRRENEAEMMFRAQEIARAILRYNRDKGPLMEFEQLAEPGSRGQYFVRKLYKDPLVRDGKWGLLYGGPDGAIYDPNASAEGAVAAMGDQAPLETEGGIRPGLSGAPREAVGLPIIGVKSLCKDKPFRVHKGQTDYSMWLFTIRDLQPMGAGGQQQGQGQIVPAEPPRGRNP